jgi:periodic tryptophan protein 1
MGNGLKGLLYHAPDESDPYITMKDGEEEEDDIDDLAVKPTDNFIIVGQTEDVYSHLEISIYDEYDNHHFVHHDIMLASYPLCLEWINFDPESDTPGNLVAVGTMSPQIEVWDLDIVDCVEPAFTLGDTKRKTKKKSRGHRSEVMALAWNKAQRNMLASGSADHTVKLWDLASQSCVRTYEHHTDKVQSVAWNPTQAPVMLTGSFDKTAQVFDSRSPDAVATWKFAADIESLTWNPFEPHVFVASTEDGNVYAADTRTSGALLFTIDAHQAAVSKVTFSNYVPGMMLTASADGTCKLWDVHQGKPSFLMTREFELGAVYAAEFSPDAPGVVGIGGMEGGLQTLDFLEFQSVQQHFAQRPISQPPQPVGRRPVAAEGADDDAIVYAAEDDDDSEEESWIDVMQELTIKPDEQRQFEEEQKKMGGGGGGAKAKGGGGAAAPAPAAAAGGGKTAKKPEKQGSKLKSKKGNKKKK